MFNLALARTAAIARHFPIVSNLGTQRNIFCSSTMASSSAATASHRLGKLLPGETALLVCDVQERFRPIISRFPAVVDTSRRMVRAAQELDLPVIVSEQYPKALGSTVPEVAEVLPEGTLVVAKTKFSMMVEEITAAIEAMPSVKNVLIVGIETHVCVLQTTLDLLEKGYTVHIVVDGVSSQRLTDRATALHRLSQSGAFMATSEMALFQMMVNTSHPAFKAVSALCKETRPEQLPGM